MNRKNLSWNCSGPGHTVPLCQHGRFDLQNGEETAERKRMREIIFYKNCQLL